MDITNLEIKCPEQEKNYNKFLNSPMKIGHTCTFIEKPNSTINSISIFESCADVKVVFEVRYCILLFGDDNQFEVHGIVTDSVSISKSLSLGGFGSHSHEHTGKLMQEAVVFFAHKNDLLICEKICSWPFSKAVTTPMTKASKNIIKFKLWN
jgi:hypothetical protein